MKFLIYNKCGFDCWGSCYNLKYLFNCTESNPLLEHFTGFKILFETEVVCLKLT